MDNNIVKCWGRNLWGELGYGHTDTIGNDETPAGAGTVNLGTGRTAKDITMGRKHTCVIMDNDQIKCFGDNANGQLGYGHTNRLGDNESVSSYGAVDLGIGRTVKKVRGGHEHTCAIMDNNEVKCWGSSAYGQLGYGNTNTIGDGETPASVGSVQTGALAKDISASATNSCVLTLGNKVKCWGANTFDQLGYISGTIGDNETPFSQPYIL